MNRLAEKSSLFIFALVLLPSSIVISMDLPNTRTTVSGDVLTTLYTNGSPLGPYFYVPAEESVNPDGTPANLKKLLNNNGFCTVTMYGVPWSESDWRNNSYKLMHGVNSPEEPDLIEKAKINIIESFKKDEDFDQDLFTLLSNHQRYEKNKYSLNKLASLLVDAKTIIKSFVLDDISPSYIQNNFIKKYKMLGRLFTYAKLEQVISENKLTHIRLPLKILLIKDTTTGKHLAQKDALKVIDECLKVCLMNDFTFKIGFISDKYEMEVFAAQEKTEGKGLSTVAMEELFILCHHAPFDIGYDNIFWDAHGNAIIIDTEHVDAEKSDCVKLKRYTLDPDL